VPDFSVSRLHAEDASIRANNRRLILVFIFTPSGFLNRIVFYIKGSLTVTSWLVGLSSQNGQRKRLSGKVWCYSCEVRSIFTQSCRLGCPTVLRNLRVGGLGFCSGAEKTQSQPVLDGQSREKCSKMP